MGINIIRTGKRLSRSEFLFLVAAVLVELVFVFVFAKTVDIIFLESAGSEWFHCLELGDILKSDFTP
jgi:hypothetical protein